MSRARPRHCQQVRAECTRGSISLCAYRGPLWSASRRSADAPAGPEASSSSPATYGSPRARRRCSANEVGPDVVAPGGPMARLLQSVSRGRALEILLDADDVDGPRAAQYGYVNRVIADDQLDNEVDRIASRLARFDHEAIARTKSYSTR